MALPNLDRLDALIEPVLQAGRIPGAGIAIVADDEVVLAKGFGHRDLERKLPITSDTLYPIASTTKPMNATLLGMLLDEGQIGWDVPVQHYLPAFCLADPVRSPLVTVRDLLTMRTGLPRHDWLWIGNAIERPDIVERFRHLELSAGFRERFQYNNLTVMLAGHIAEMVTGKSWEALIRERLLDPLGMNRTGFTLPSSGDFSLGWHESADRELVPSERFAAEHLAPAGGAIHSSVADMGKWIAFNLNGGKVGDRQLIQPETLAEIHRSHMAIGGGLPDMSPHSTYGLGWKIDSHRGCARLSHGGYLQDFCSDVSVFPEQAIGLVTFTNFGCPGLSSLINLHVLDTMMGKDPEPSLDAKLARYEELIEERRTVNSAAARVANTAPTHPLEDYGGRYSHPGYGDFEMRLSGNTLVAHRGDIEVPLQHWHYDSWVGRNCDQFTIHARHPFEPANRFLFETDSDGRIAAFSTRLEPLAKPLRFEKRNLGP